MANPKVNKGKSGSQNDSIKQRQKIRQLKKGGDPSLISDKTLETTKKKK